MGFGIPFISRVNFGRRNFPIWRRNWSRRGELKKRSRYKIQVFLQHLFSAINLVLEFRLSYNLKWNFSTSCLINFGQQMLPNFKSRCSNITGIRIIRWKATVLQIHNQHGDFVSLILLVLFFFLLKKQTVFCRNFNPCIPYVLAPLPLLRYIKVLLHTPRWGCFETCFFFNKSNFSVLFLRKRNGT